ncbi:hypothetical protein [Rhodanobacter sp. BL-MT-08]
MHPFKFTLGGTSLLSWRGLAYLLTGLVAVVSTVMLFGLATRCFAGFVTDPTVLLRWWRHPLACLKGLPFGTLGTTVVIVVIVVPLLVVCRHIGAWILATVGGSHASKESKPSDDGGD